MPEMIVFPVMVPVPVPLTVVLELVLRAPVRVALPLTVPLPDRMPAVPMPTALLAWVEPFSCKVPVVMVVAPV